MAAVEVVKLGLRKPVKRRHRVTLPHHCAKCLPEADIGKPYMPGAGSKNTMFPDWYAAGIDHIWLPYAQMKTAWPSLAVARTHGSRIVLADGRELIDGIASWWTACHGYNQPAIQEAVARQLAQMPHVMFGGLVHEQPLRLARRLCVLLPGDLDRVFYSDSGSVAVEVALKMAIQYWANRGTPRRRRFVSFIGGYHGDTAGAMAVCDPAVGMHGIFSDLEEDHPVVALPRDGESTTVLDRTLDRHADDLAGIIVEPLVQGAGGMLFHEPETLRQLRILADKYELLLIFDEIFTGFGRTGTMFACEAAGIAPDIITLSKALTGGTLPLAATVATHKVFDAFWSDDPKRALMHGPTFMANALACAAANASLDLFDSEPRLQQVAKISVQLTGGLAPCRDVPGVKDVRVQGAIGAVEMARIADLSALRAAFIEEGVFVRPFGNVIYLTPAFTVVPEDLTALTDAVVKVIQRYT
jgi:adenosylmethionine---8-amino-7-oxononanoate aminotransferase